MQQRSLFIGEVAERPADPHIALGIVVHRDVDQIEQQVDHLILIFPGTILARMGMIEVVIRPHGVGSFLDGIGQRIVGAQFQLPFVPKRFQRHLQQRQVRDLLCVFGELIDELRFEPLRAVREPNLQRTLDGIFDLLRSHAA
jgi:hypothetical protein